MLLETIARFYRVRKVTIERPLYDVIIPPMTNADMQLVALMNRADRELAKFNKSTNAEKHRMAAKVFKDLEVIRKGGSVSKSRR
jgi:hypothetical protein